MLSILMEDFLSYMYKYIHKFKARALVRALQFENLTIDCNPLLIPVVDDSRKEFGGNCHAEIYSP